MISSYIEKDGRVKVITFYIRLCGSYQLKNFFYFNCEVNPLYLRSRQIRPIYFFNLIYNDYLYYFYSMLDPHRSAHSGPRVQVLSLFVQFRPSTKSWNLSTGHRQRWRLEGSGWFYTKRTELFINRQTSDNPNDIYHTITGVFSVLVDSLHTIEISVRLTF